MSESDKHYFPVGRAAAMLSAVAVALAMLSLVAAQALGLARPTLAALLFAAAVTWLASLLGMLPLRLLGHHGAQSTITGYFLGMGARVMVCLFAGLTGVYAMRLPTEPLLLGLAAMYLPTLGVEAAVVASYLLAKDTLTRHDGARPNGVVA